MNARTPDTHPPVPLGLRALCRATGIADAADVSAAYAAALRLVEDVNHDCNPTYCAITDLRAALDPDDRRHEDAVFAALKQGTDTLDAAMDDHYGSLTTNIQHASFLLGAAYVFVMMAALASPDRSGGAR